MRLSDYFSVYPLLFAVAVVFVLCYLIKNEISVGGYDEHGYSDDASRRVSSSTSPEERAYLHYVVYSTVVVVGMSIAFVRRNRLTHGRSKGG
jgi:hypothetical protein